MRSSADYSDTEIVLTRAQFVLLKPCVYGAGENSVYEAPATSLPEEGRGCSFRGFGLRSCKRAVRDRPEQERRGCVSTPGADRHCVHGALRGSTTGTP